MMKLSDELKQSYLNLHMLLDHVRHADSQNLEPAIFRFLDEVDSHQLAANSILRRQQAITIRYERIWTHEVELKAKRLLALIEHLQYLDKGSESWKQAMSILKELLVEWSGDEQNLISSYSFNDDWIKSHTWGHDFSAMKTELFRRKATMDYGL